MTFLGSYQRAQILLVGAAIACFAFFWFAGAKLAVPVHPGHESSLLQQPSPAAAIIGAAIVLIGSVALGTAVAGLVRYDAGVFVAAIGLAALSIRGGSSRHVIFHALATGAGTRVYLTLMIETAILGVMVGFCAWVLDRIYRSGKLQDRESILPPGVEASAASDLSTLGIQTVVTAVGVLLLVPSEAKFQALWGVGIAAWGGAALAETVMPITRRTWVWAPPIVVGMVGYLAAYFSYDLKDDGFLTGNIEGAFAALARPVPLDYASAGVAGAILGYWMGRRWARERAAEQSASSEQAAG